ncbi:uncharacterized protein [Elaeis guineensis]|uniref:Uncharacterized protein LOC105052474 n=1 Tax=Elaeis guineensis var. tenera TaxID=51953 RepID=A0A6I9RTC9_ELAGV|nr:uncharacterized protein LOC105052474 [Elaeis guineensis]
MVCAQVLGFNFQSASLPELEYCNLMSQVEDRLRFTVACVAWSIWTARNDRLFRNLTVTPTQVYRRALFLLPDFNCINTALLRQNCSWNWGAIRSVLPAPTDTNLVCWLPPPMGVLKINFDASLSSKEAGAAYVIRDYQGKLIRAGGKRLATSSVSFAELVAAWAGVAVALYQLQVKDLWVEGDSLVVIRWLSKSGASNLAEPLLHHLQVWKQRFHSFRVTHTFREGNRAADFLASSAILSYIEIGPDGPFA